MVPLPVARLLLFSRAREVPAHKMRNAPRYQGRRALAPVLPPVQDEGVGMASADVAHIFERFYRSDEARGSSTGGTGLGLSIVKHGAMIHGAKVRVRSELGKGTTMEILFPRA